MTHRLSAAVDDALRQRELLLKGVLRAKAHDDDGQAVHLEYLLEAFEDLLAMAVCNEARH
jgi:hypothetical protein